MSTSHNTYKISTQLPPNVPEQFSSHGFPLRSNHPRAIATTGLDLGEEERFELYYKMR